MFDFLFRGITEAVRQQIFLDGFLVGCVLCILIFVVFSKDKKP